ncbi:MAG: hypothetical protein LAT65_13460 [Saccharospirillum sp.]|nr:hypothetical protein [Saccharospirillum sp.]
MLSRRFSPLLSLYTINRLAANRRTSCFLFTVSQGWGRVGMAPITMPSRG